MLHFSVRIPRQEAYQLAIYKHSNGGSWTWDYHETKSATHVLVKAGLHIRNLAFLLAAWPNHLTVINNHELRQMLL